MRRSSTTDAAASRSALPALTTNPEPFRRRTTVYAFETEPSVKALFTERLTLQQATRLHKFLDSLSLVRDASTSVSGRLIEVDSEILAVVIGALLGNPQLAIDPSLVRAALTMSPELCRTLIETELTSFDLSCLAYRRAQLDTMSALLADEAAFAKYQAQVGAEGKEAAWQAFFEKNQWILGYALNYIIGEGVQPDKLEQVVAGYSIAGAGKRVDALLHTRGVIRSLCYLEIKTHETSLLHGTEYRPDVWRPSNELAGAVAQSQKTVQLAAQHLQTKCDVPVSADQSGGDRFFNYAPRAIVVCGHLREFATPTGLTTPSSAPSSCIDAASTRRRSSPSTSFTTEHVRSWRRDWWPRALPLPPRAPSTSCPRRRSRFGQVIKPNR